MIFEHHTNGGWVGFDTYYVKKLGRSIPRLGVGIIDGDKIKIQYAFLIYKNTEILPNLYKAIGHYLGHRKEENNTCFQHEQETVTGSSGENQQCEQETYTE